MTDISTLSTSRVVGTSLVANAMLCIAAPIVRMFMSGRPTKGRDMNNTFLSFQLVGGLNDGV